MLRASLRSVLTAPGFPDRASPFQSSMVSTAPQPCPSPGRAIKRAPGRAVWSGSVIRAGRREFGEVWCPGERSEPGLVRACSDGGLNRECVSSHERCCPWSPRERSEQGGSRDAKRLSSCGKSPIFQQLRRACSPGGLKGRGVVAWAERALSERRRSEDIPLRARERAEGFQVVCVCDRSEKYEPTSRPVFHQWRLVHHLSNSRRRATRPATIRHPTTAPISPTGSSGFPPPQSASKTSP